MKRILSIAVMLIVTAYLAVAFTWINRPAEGNVCHGVKVIMEDSARSSFVTADKVSDLLKQNRLYPTGTPMDSIRCRDIENVLEKNNFIESAECYKTPLGDLCISIRQRIPILRVMPAGSTGYYIDSKGHSMPQGNHAAHLPIATGHINKKMAEGTLYHVARLLYEDSFWSRQVEQINVTADGDLELVPRVGEHILFLGKPTHIEEKLDRIRDFYTKGLCRVGWNKYSRISVEFDNQVICKRK